MAIKSLFRYSGNKGRLLKFYKEPLGARIVEPYLGSGAFTINHGHVGLGIETNADVVAMWEWLQNVEEDELWELQHKIEYARIKELKPDVKTMGLELGPQTYVRINVCSVVVGQLSSWKIYPQFSLPIKKTVIAIEFARKIQVIHGDALSYIDLQRDGDMLFIDPPYIGTRANYKQKAKKGIEESYSPSQTIELIENTSCPVIFTYGDGAADLFPDYEWEVAKIRKVPNIRRGGTIERTEYVSHIRWE